VSRLEPASTVGKASSAMTRTTRRTGWRSWRVGVGTTGAITPVGEPPLDDDDQGPPQPSRRRAGPPLVRLCSTLRPARVTLQRWAGRSITGRVLTVHRDLPRRALPCVRTSTASRPHAARPGPVSPPCVERSNAVCQDFPETSLIDPARQRYTPKVPAFRMGLQIRGEQAGERAPPIAGWA
jgi:hypothetical protein